ncbi:glycosyltransferase family 8 protein [Vibrio sp. MEBiC08052]|uniref:glycosyltransferase family 8 protein n=1 Tax=Vibrio sp. MEBiC08052 TaxID=1761910 RepID=UPI0007407552|nr:glycosyltransferase [Vibrio sp. MEBiC08052]KUI97036.1 hypothetical protein VRK_38910 [Vibrio sp. MEBiC08052]
MYPVVLCGNHAYKDQFQVFAHSFRKHNPDRKAVMFHTGDFDLSLLEKYQIDSQIVAPLDGTSDRFNATHMHGALLRLVAFDWLAEHWPEQTALYVDLDTLVCGDIAQADTIALTDDKPLAGIGEYHALSELEGNARYAEHRPLYWFQRHLNNTYFNAGVLVVNPSGLQRKATAKGYQSIAHCYTCNQYKWPMADQDCLNYLVPNQILLPRTLNAMPELSIWFLADRISFEHISEGIQDSTILHWVGTMKPWSASKQNNHTDPDRQMMPLDRYLATCDEIKDDLDKAFYRTVKINTTIWKSVRK